MWWRRRPDKRHGARGFILIEVLVAAAVAAVLLAAVMRIFASTWSGVNSVREDADAMLVARNVLEAVAPRNNLAPGTQQGTSGRYAWTVVITGPPAPAGGATGAGFGQPALQQAAASNNENAPDASTGPPWSLFRIIVAVTAPSGRRTIIDTYRLSRPSA
jgi:type II secretory pathway pseudopilin PulG